MTGTSYYSSFGCFGGGTKWGRGILSITCSNSTGYLIDSGGFLARWGFLSWWPVDVELVVDSIGWLGTMFPQLVVLAHWEGWST